MARGWYLLAPVQWSTAGVPPDVSYGSPQSQLHVEAVMGELIQEFAIDPERLYGVGFSMGGGAALSYAARHRDLRQPGVFAAVLNNTGSVALSHVYASLSSTNNQFGYLELLFGGTPSASPFRWQQSSLIVLDSTGGLDPAGSHFASNLVNVPVQTWYNGLDTTGYLQVQSREFDSFLASVGAVNHSLVRHDYMGTAQYPCTNGHCWGTLDQQMACDWLSLQTLAAPAGTGTVLADRSGGWEIFELEQRSAGQFSSFDYSIDPLAATLVIQSLENVERIEFELSDAGLSAPIGSILKADVTHDTGVFALQLTGVSTAPVNVYLNGGLLVQDCTGQSAGDGWCFDASNGRLELRADSQLTNSWRLEF